MKTSCPRAKVILAVPVVAVRILTKELAGINPDRTNLLGCVRAIVTANATEEAFVTSDTVFQFVPESKLYSKNALAIDDPAIRGFVTLRFIE